MLLVGNATWADGRGQGNNSNSQGSKGNEAGDDRAVRLLATVPISGTKANTTGDNLYVFDISWVDQGSRRSVEWVDILPVPRIRSAQTRTQTYLVPLDANNVYPDCLTGCIAVYSHEDEDKAGVIASPQLPISAETLRLVAAHSESSLVPGSVGTFHPGRTLLEKYNDFHSRPTDYS